MKDDGYLFIGFNSDGHMTFEHPLVGTMTAASTPAHGSWTGTLHRARKRVRLARDAEELARREDKERRRLRRLEVAASRPRKQPPSPKGHPTPKRPRLPARDELVSLGAKKWAWLMERYRGRRTP